MKEYLKKSSGTPLVFMWASICCNCVILECSFGRCLNGPLAFQQGQKACAPRLPGRFVRAKDRVGHVLPPVVDDDFPACVHAKAPGYGKGCRVHGTLLRDIVRPRSQARRAAKGFFGQRTEEEWNALPPRTVSLPMSTKLVKRIDRPCSPI